MLSGDEIDMKRYLRQLGQGMTEYIIIVALIAIAAIAAYSFFGDTLRSQVGGMAQEMAGQDGAGQIGVAQKKAASTVGQSEHATLGKYAKGATAQ
jgi:Flp pilus assembly pilin Flp